MDQPSDFQNLPPLQPQSLGLTAGQPCTPPQTRDQAVDAVYQLLGMEQLPSESVLQGRIKDISTCVTGSCPVGTVEALAKKINDLVNKKQTTETSTGGVRGFFRWLDKCFGVTAEGTAEKAAEGAMEGLLAGIRAKQYEEASTIHHALSGGELDKESKDLLKRHRVLDASNDFRSAFQVSQAAKQAAAKAPENGSIRYFAQAVEKCALMAKKTANLSPEEGNTQAQELCSQVDTLESGEYALNSAGYRSHYVSMTWEKVGGEKDTYICSLYNTGAGVGLHLVDINRIGSEKGLLLSPQRFKVVGKNNKDKFITELKLGEIKFATKEEYNSYIKKACKENLCQEIKHYPYERLMGKTEDELRELEKVSYPLQCVGTCTHEALMMVAMDRCGNEGLHQIKQVELTQTVEKVKRLRKSLERTGDFYYVKDPSNSKLEELKRVISNLFQTDKQDQKANKEQVTSISRIAEQQFDLLQTLRNPQKNGSPKQAVI